MRKASLRLLLLLLLPLLLLSSFIGPEASAAGNGKIIMDNKELVLPVGVTLENVNGNVMIPIRVVVENLGFNVQWEQKTRKVTVRQDGKSVELSVGSKTANSDGNTLNLNAAPKQTGGTVLVPIRFVGEHFGLKVGWDNGNKTVLLTSGNPNGSDNVPYSEGTFGNGVNVPEITPIPIPTPTQNPSSTPTIAPTPSPSPGNGALLATSQVKGAVFSENRLMIAAPGAAKPIVSTMKNPYRIIVDFPHAVFAENFNGDLAGKTVIGNLQGKLDITGYPQVSEVRYALFSSDPSTVRFVIQMTGDFSYEVSMDESSGLTTVDLNVPSATFAPIGAVSGSGKPVVVLDAGHGGTQPGAVSRTKKLEKDFNLAVILKAASLLEQEENITVILTRSNDSTLGLQERVKIAESVQANLFISLHANAMPSSYTNWHKVNGSETYYSRSESIPLAQIMHKHLVAGTGLKDNGIRNKSLHVTRETSMPAVLLEAGYLTHANDEASLYTESLQNALAKEIVAGIKEYLGL